MTTVRGFGTPVDSGAAVGGGTISVAAKSSELLVEAQAFAKAYSKAPASDRPALLRAQTIGGKLDQFVIDCANGKIKLPEGTSALDVISPAVVEFLKLGIPYSVEVRAHIGGQSHSATALTPDGKPDWHSYTQR